MHLIQQRSLPQDKGDVVCLTFSKAYLLPFSRICIFLDVIEVTIRVSMKNKKMKENIIQNYLQKRITNHLHER